jgi:hypothetical protein
VRARRSVRVIAKELLSLLDKGEVDQTARLMADRDRLRQEVKNLMALAASGVPAETIAPEIRERQSQMTKLDKQLAAPRQARPNIERLREALESGIGSSQERRVFSLVAFNARRQTTA